MNDRIALFVERDHPTRKNLPSGDWRYVGIISTDSGWLTLFDRLGPIPANLPASDSEISSHTDEGGESRI